MIEYNKEILKKLRKYYEDNTSHLSQYDKSEEQINLKDKIDSLFYKFNNSIEIIDEVEINNLKILIDDCVLIVKRDKINGYLEYLKEKIIDRCESPYNIDEKEKIQKTFDYFNSIETVDIKEFELDYFSDLITKFMYKI